MNTAWSPHFKPSNSAFAEGEWEGLLFCGRRCFNNNRKVIRGGLNKNKGRLLWQTDGPTPEINSMAVIIDWLTKEGNYNPWHGGNRQNCTTKLGEWNQPTHQRQGNHCREASAGDTLQDQSSWAAFLGGNRLAEPDRGQCDLRGKHQGSSKAEVSVLLWISWRYEWQGQHHSTIHHILNQAIGDWLRGTSMNEDNLHHPEPEQQIVVLHWRNEQVAIHPAFGSCLQNVDPHSQTCSTCHNCYKSAV